MERVDHGTVIGVGEVDQKLAMDTTVDASGDWQMGSSCIVIHVSQKIPETITKPWESHGIVQMEQMPIDYSALPNPFYSVLTVL